MCVDRIAAKPVMIEGYLKNSTCVVNSTATFHCKVLVDQSVHIIWARTRVLNESDNISLNATTLKVLICLGWR